MTNREKLYSRLTLPTKYKNLDNQIKELIFQQNCSASHQKKMRKKKATFNEQVQNMLLQAYFQTPNCKSQFRNKSKYLESFEDNFLDSHIQDEFDYWFKKQVLKPTTSVQDFI